LILTQHKNFGSRQRLGRLVLCTIIAKIRYEGTNNCRFVVFYEFDKCTSMVRPVVKRLECGVDFF